MGFPDLKSEAGLTSLNNYLADRSYIEGYVPSQADSVVFAALSGAPSDKLNHALRWFSHISSYDANERKAFPGDKKSLSSYGPAGNETEDNKDDDEEFDLFASDSEDEEEKLKQQRVESYQAKKAKKAAVIAKSSLLLDVKPWDDETDMQEMEKQVRAIEADGLVWGASKLKPVGYGIKKLQIAAVIEDDKISTDFLEEQITAIEDLVQSMDIAAFNKI
ncbi:Elongation factor 1-beta [Trichoplax sp. H2]|nr:Elongation factor 1-beta [Trichoplax sp. H2]|eukprot:RDD45101.1 Elongation factor 1-beta [Trichoplax sp. H2]